MELEKPILKVLDLPDRVLVLLDNERYPASDPNKNRNLIAVDKNGRFLWRIEESKPIMRDGEPDPDPFIGMRLENDGQRVVVCDMDGLTLDLDPKTGGLSNPVFTR